MTCQSTSLFSTSPILICWVLGKISGKTSSSASSRAATQTLLTSNVKRARRSSASCRRWSANSSSAEQTICFPSTVSTDQSSLCVLSTVLTLLVTTSVPVKHEHVVFCRMSPFQLALYRLFIKSPEIKKLLRGTGSQPLKAIGMLKKLCNHPDLLNLSEDLEGSEEFFPEGYSPNDRRNVHPEYSGKMLVLERFLDQIKRTTNDKIVLISNYTQTLDIFEKMCRNKKYVKKSYHALCSFRAQTHEASSLLQVWLLPPRRNDEHQQAPKARRPVQRSRRQRVCFPAQLQSRRLWSEPHWSQSPGPVRPWYVKRLATPLRTSTAEPLLSLIATPRLESGVRPAGAGTSVA